ncbi:MAG: VanZ family protein [Bacilli bacterium]|nr:VanZ family protein [Bacilli bacterium]MDD4298062.1 VanZ family protein [Bacilli bacterium]MDD4643437.1 VanZ family protein [Bacilli bacterium]
MFKVEVLEVLRKAWPMLLVFTVIMSSIRLAYLKTNRMKFVFHKEFFTLLFMLYVLVLFYVVTAQDPVSYSISSYNLIPFREMLRYNFGTKLFFKNIVGNLLIFIPFGLFVSYYLKAKRLSLTFILSLISSLTIEFAQRLIVGRVFDVDDIMLNVMGAIIGYFIYIIIDTIGNHMPKIFKKPWFINLLIIIILILGFMYIFDFDIKMIEGFV